MPSATQNSPESDLAAYQSQEPAALVDRIQQIRDQMGPRLLILGHHYQRDEVIALADLRGDSYQLAKMAAESQSCRAIVFCGVHFMAETADILANRPERLLQRDGQRIPVILPNLAAGCSLADMADVAQVEDCWRQLGSLVDLNDVTPITYVNSTAALKAFCGRHGGIVCTSANAQAVLDWAFARRSRVLFFPDQHLARNTARAMGVPLSRMPMWDPREKQLGGVDPDAIRQSRVILWQGHCCVHQAFLPSHVTMLREQFSDIKILVHPECMAAVVEQADEVGSTGAIIRAVEQSPPGTRWAIGTEWNLVNRLKNQHPEQDIHFLSPVATLCETMYRIDLPHLCWALDHLVAGSPINVVEVEPDVARDALESLQRMLQVGSSR
ncbi:MAG: quinolinate synthase NadA [Thermoguttaceae bacterium]